MAVKLVKQFQVYQEDRIRTFNDLDAAHQEFLSHAPNYEEAFDDFKKSVSRVTDSFKEISKEIIEIKAELDRKHKETKLGDLIGKVQELEEKKLQVVVDYQLAAQQALDNPGDDLCDKNAKLIKSQLMNLCEEITDVLTDIRCEAYDMGEESADR